MPLIINDKNTKSHLIVTGVREVFKSGLNTIGVRWSDNAQVWVVDVNAGNPEYIDLWKDVLKLFK